MGDGRRQIPGKTMFSMLREAHFQGIKQLWPQTHAAPDFILLTWNSIQNGLLKHLKFLQPGGFADPASSRCRDRMDLSGAHGTTGKIPTIGRNRLCIVRVLRDISWQAATDAVNQLISRRLPPDTGASERYLIFLQSPKKVLRFRHETGVLLQVNANTILNPQITGYIDSWNICYRKTV